MGFLGQIDVSSKSVWMAASQQVPFWGCVPAACRDKGRCQSHGEQWHPRLDVALGSLVWWLATLHIAGGWNEMSIVVLFNPGHSMI